MKTLKETETEAAAIAAEFDNAVPVEEIVLPDKKQRGKKLKPLEPEPPLPPPDPAITDAEWQDFVMGHFAEDEINEFGRPFTHALRRVGQVLLGPILESYPVVQSTTTVNGIVRAAVVEWHLKLLMCKLIPGQDAAYPVHFADVADVHADNIDPMFLRYASASAATRAEGRAWRKALQLRIIAAEETSPPLAATGENAKITADQMNFLRVQAGRIKVDLKKTANEVSGQKYDRLEDVPYKTAEKLTEALATYANKPHTIPDSIRKN